MNQEEIKQALLLRSQGTTYPNIAEMLGYSEDKVFYHCEPSQKMKRKKRNKENPHTAISDKLRFFTQREGHIPLDVFFKKFENNPICWLTGRPINLKDGTSYQLDHIVPKSKGGQTTIDNLQIACKIANEAKTNLLIDEFLELCHNVMNKHSEKVYQVPKLPPPLTKLPVVNYTHRYNIRYKIAKFSYRKPHRQAMFIKVDDFIKKYGNVTSCYLSGQPIDILDPFSYSFDHIVPVSRGGRNTEDNLGFATPIANQSKQDMLVQDYINLCNEVVAYHTKIRTQT